jgi:hypothetical protein
VRRRTGHLKSPKKPGDLFVVEFSLTGERHYVSLPGSADWDRERAERERAYLMEKVNRGEWRPTPLVDTLSVAPPPTDSPAYADVAAEALAR